MIIPDLRKGYGLLHQGVLALAKAERQGMRIDIEYCERKKKELTEEIERVEEKFKSTKFYRHWKHSRGGKEPNINSNPQLAHFLYKVKKINPAKLTVTGEGSTDEDALKQLGIKELYYLLRIRKLKKLRDTYLDAFVREQINGILHPFFHLHTAKTYRSSSDKPNFQNIPKRDKEAQQLIRKAIYPRKDHLLMSVDYSSLEVRIAACYHKDPTMLNYINDPNSDMHGDMAKQIFKLNRLDKSKSDHKLLRNAVKNGFVFPQFYGDYYKNNAKGIAIDWCKLPNTKRWKPGQGVEFEGKNISDHLISVGLSSYFLFEQHLKRIEKDFWSNRFSVYAKWKEKQWKFYLRKGYVPLYTGFKCIGVMGRNDVINYPIQGSAFHCLLWSFIETTKELEKRKLDTKLIGQIHDEMILDVQTDEVVEIKEILHEIMTERIREYWDWIIVPLEIEIKTGKVDKPWSEL